MVLTSLAGESHDFTWNKVSEEAKALRFGIVDQQAATKSNKLFKPHGQAPELPLNTIPQTFIICITNLQIVLVRSSEFKCSFDRHDSGYLLKRKFYSHALVL